MVFGAIVCPLLTKGFDVQEGSYMPSTKSGQIENSNNSLMIDDESTRQISGTIERANPRGIKAKLIE